MKMRIPSFVVAGLLVVAGGAIRPAEAQQRVGDVTFTVPLNITQLSPDITKVAVYCRITGPAITTRSGNIGAQVELVPQGGQVVTTATVVVTWPLTDMTDPTGTQANYDCLLSGFSNSLQRWDRFYEEQATPVFRLKPTPPALTGTFTW
jgi:hypothetical protein